MKNLNVDQKELQTELEEKKKKEKLREAENYFIAAGTDKKAEVARATAAEQQRVKDLFSDRLKKDLPKLYEDSKKLHDASLRYTKRIKELFKADKEHIEKCKKLGISEDKLQTLAVCSLKKNQDKALQHCMGEIELSEQDKQDIHQEYKAEMEKSLKEMEQNAYSKISKDMGDSLKKFNKLFKETNNKEKAMQISKQISDVLDVFKAKPEFLKGSGLNKADIEAAKEAAYFGQSIEEGLQAIESLAKNAMEGGKPFSENEQLKMVNKITNMQTIMYVKNDTKQLEKSPVSVGGK